VLAVLLSAVALLGGALLVQDGVSMFDTSAAPSTTSPGLGSSNTPNGSSGGSSSGRSSSGGTSTAPSSWADVADAINPGVVNVETRLPQGVGAGTGIVLSDSGEILTNNHVIDGALQIVVTVSTTGDQYDATVVGTDAQHDVAVLQLDGASGLTTAPIGDSDDVQVGDAVAAIGNAGGQGGEPAVAPGKVTALHQQITATDEAGGDAQTLTDMIQVDADVEPGDSGGPLVNSDAKVIGIDAAASASSSRYRTAEHQGYAIPINRAISIAESIEANPNGSSGSASSGSGSSGSRAGRAGYLGVEIDPTSSARGAAVVGVAANSPAKAAGLVAGDVITAVDGTAVASADQLTSVMRTHEAGDQVTVTWTDAKGKSHRDSLTLAAG
jgi:S1-C subfamily serine protease